MRGRAGLTAVTAIAVLLGVLVVTQYRAQDVFTRSLTAENASSLTTVIAQISDRNSSLRDEILQLRIRLDAAQGASQSNETALRELQEQFQQARLAAGVTAASGPGIAVDIDGAFDDKAMSDLVNEMRNAGAEAIGVNGHRIGPRSWFAHADNGIVVDGVVVGTPYRVDAIGAPDTLAVAMSRTGGIIGQLELIYGNTRFLVSQQKLVDLPAADNPDFVVAKPVQ